MSKLKENAAGCFGVIVVLLCFVFLGAVFVKGPGRFFYYFFVSKELGAACKNGHECAMDATCVERMCRKKCEADSECSSGEHCLKTTGFSKVCAR
jgi:hypothetical protein